MVLISQILRFHGSGFGHSEKRNSAGGFSSSSTITTSRTLTPGDINGDGQIDSKDLSILMSNFGLVVENIIRAGADLNGDGQVDSSDLSLLMEGFNQSEFEVSW